MKCATYSTCGVYSEGCVYFAQSSYCAATIRGQHLFRTELLTVWRLFKGGTYLKQYGTSINKGQSPSQRKLTTWHTLSKMRLLHRLRVRLWLITIILSPSELALSFQSYVSSVCKSRMCITFSLLHEIVIPYKRAYCSLKLQSRSPTRSLAMSAQAYQTLHTAYWTLN